MKQNNNEIIGIYYTRNEKAKKRPNRATSATIYFSYFNNLSTGIKVSLKGVRRDGAKYSFSNRLAGLNEWNDAREEVIDSKILAGLKKT